MSSLPRGVATAGQMALVGEANFLRDQSKRLVGLAHQGLRPFEPPLHDVTRWPDADRLACEKSG